jgi:hypothetical protein
MREQPHYTDLLTEDFFIEHYNRKRMSYPQIAEMLQKQGYPIVAGTIYKYAKKFGIGRDASEAKRNREENPLDYSVSYMTESTLEAVDGFLLGDGGINFDERSPSKIARFQCSLEHEEFCVWLMGFFHRYQPQFSPRNSPKSPNGVVQEGRTKMHPDVYNQMRRWYPDSGTKQPPDDVRITPLSVMMWYLGDGSLVVNEQKNTVMLRLSTDGFSEERVEFLAGKLRDQGIACHRNGDNRIQVEARGIAAFFDFIGRESPVKCYAYKFDLPDWRFKAKRMREVADELGVDYNRLSHLVKTGRVPCFRASENGKPRFLPEHVEAIRIKR